MDLWNVVRTLLVLGAGLWSGWLQYRARRDDTQRDIEVARSGAADKVERIKRLESALAARDEQVIALARELAVLEHKLNILTDPDVSIGADSESEQLAITPQDATWTAEQRQRR